MSRLIEVLALKTACLPVEWKLNIPCGKEQLEVLETR
jgi:hypothetical protein